MWDTLLNLLLLLFWVRIWNEEYRKLAANPFLVGFARVQQGILRYLHPVLPFLAPRLLAAAAFVFLLVFRGLAVPPKAEWVVHLGFAVTQFQPGSILGGIVFSILSFGAFLFKLWGLSLIYVHAERIATVRPTTDALAKLARPFVSLDMAVRPPLLLVLGAALGYGMNHLGVPPEGANSYESASALVLSARLLIVAVSGWVGLLPLIQSLLILTIIGSWVSMFTGSYGLASFCHEWIEMLIGPLRRYPVRVGTLDLTPLIFMILLGVVHGALQMVLLESFKRIT
jgi:uncharacterized protein YggT (Ycf19 family)